MNKLDAELEKLSAEELQALEAEVDQQLMAKHAAEVAQTYYNMGVELANEFVKSGELGKTAGAALGSVGSWLGRKALSAGAAGGGFGFGQKTLRSAGMFMLKNPKLVGGAATGAGALAAGYGVKKLTG